MIHRKINDDAFNIAHQCSNNRNIIKKVTSKYRNYLHEDDLVSCGLQALWRTLQCHDDSYGQKFTTSLYRFCEWECQREIRNHRRKANGKTVSISVIPRENLENIYFQKAPKNFDEIIEILETKEKEIIFDFFKQGKNFTEISRELGISKSIVKRKISKLIKKLKTHYINRESLLL